MKIVNYFIKILLLLSALLLVQSAHIHAEKAEKQHIKDSLYLQNLEVNYTIEQGKFNQKKLAEFRENNDFLYDRPPPSPTLWQKFLRWLSEQTNEPLMETESFFFDIGQYFLMAFMLIFLISWFLKANISHLFLRRETKHNIQYNLNNENIYELDFDADIRSAVLQQNYRKAIRLYYLKSLKLLTDQKLIHWDIDKTNQEYLNELKGQSIHHSFKRITYLFDHIWYGNFAVNRQIYEQLEQQFSSFNQQIKQGI